MRSSARWVRRPELRHNPRHKSSRGHLLPLRRPWLGSRAHGHLRQRHGYVRLRCIREPDSLDVHVGAAIGHTVAPSPNNYLYAGEQFDPDLNLYYNRARYLNVSTGRFWSMDSFEGDPETPLALHKYLYSESNPIDRVDRSGHFSTAEIILVGAVLTVLDTLTILHFTVKPARIGVYWKTNFNWNRYVHGKKDPTARLDVASVKQNAIDELAKAFGPYGASVFEGQAQGSGGHTIEVDDALGPRGRGLTRTSPSNYSWIGFDCIVSNAASVMNSSDPEIVGAAAGRGVGRIGAHEVGHQLALSAVKSDSNLRGYYNGGDSSDPTCYDETGQMWTGESKEELPSKIKPFL